jgi:predicted ribosomally synthesized peptide with SipW-like signal peptide
MKKLIVITLLVVMISASAGIATYAWFTSSATSTNNTFNAGTLLISKTSETPTPMFHTDNLSMVNAGTGIWYPSKVVKGRHMAVKNAGTLDASVYGISAVMHSFSGPNNNSEDEFKENMIITVRYGLEFEHVLYIGPLEDLMANTQKLQLENEYLVLSPQDEITLEFQAEMSGAAGNDIQGATANVDIVIHATQDNEAAINEFLSLN